jgi:hypothetical protein
LKAFGKAVNTASELQELVDWFMAGGVVVTFAKCTSLYSACIKCTAEMLPDCAPDSCDKICEASKKCYEDAPVYGILLMTNAAVVMEEGVAGTSRRIISKHPVRSAAVARP